MWLSEIFKQFWVFEDADGRERAWNHPQQEATARAMWLSSENEQRYFRASLGLSLKAANWVQWHL